jgi:hypothetical protein
MRLVRLFYAGPHCAKRTSSYEFRGGLRRQRKLRFRHPTEKRAKAQINTARRDRKIEAGWPEPGNRGKSE